MGIFKRQLTVSTSLFGGPILILGVLLSVLGNDLAKQTRGIVAQREELASRTQSISALAQLQTDSNEAARYTSILANILPTRDQLIDFSKELEVLAREQKVGFGFSFGGEQSASNATAGRAAFTLTIQGTQNQIFTFLETLERSRFLMTFSSFDINRTSDAFSAITQGEVFFK